MGKSPFCNGKITINMGQKHVSTKQPIRFPSGSFWMNDVMQLNRLKAKILPRIAMVPKRRAFLARPPSKSHESVSACAIRPRNFPLLKFIVNWPGNEYLETVGIAETLLGSASNWPPSQPQDQEEGFLRWCAERCAVQRNPQLRGSSMTNTRFNLGIQSIFGKFTIRGTC